MFMTLKVVYFSFCYCRFLAILSCLILSVLATIEDLNEEYITKIVLYIVSILISIFVSIL